MDGTQQLMRKIVTMLLSIVFVHLSVQENLHSNSYEVNVFSVKMQNSEKGETLKVSSLNVYVLLLYFETKKNKGFKYLELVLLR